MDFDDEILMTAEEFGLSHREATILVARRFIENPLVTPLSRAMLEVMLADLQQRELVWH